MGPFPSISFLSLLPSTYNKGCDVFVTLNAVFFLVVIENIVVLTKNDLFCLLEIQINDFVVLMLVIVGHHDLIGKLSLQQHLLLFLVLEIMKFVEVVNESQDCLTANDFHSK